MEIFFHHRASPFVRKVLLGILELGVDTVDRAIDFSSTEAMEEYEQINPNRRFPALRDGELVLWESNAILRYLARRTPWLGQTDNAAALVEQWLCWELAHLGPTLLGLQNYRLGFLPLPPHDEATLIADKERLLGILDQSWMVGSMSYRTSRSPISRSPLCSRSRKRLSSSIPRTATSAAGLTRCARVRHGKRPSA